MTDRLDPKLYEEVKLFAIRLAENAERFKQTVLRANDVENISDAFDPLLDVVGDTRDALEEQLGEGAFDEEDDEDEEGEGGVDEEDDGLIEVGDGDEESPL